MNKLTFCLILLVIQPVAAQPTLRFGEGIAAPQDTLSIPIYLDHREPISGIRAVVSFDQAALFLHSVVPMLENLRLYTTELDTDADLVFVDPVGGRVLSPGVRELARLILQVKPGAIPGAYPISVSKLELTGHTLPPNRIEGDVQTGSIWVTTDQVSIGADWLSHNEVQIDLNVRTDSPISAAQLSINWSVDALVFDHLQTDLDWQIFEHTPRKQVLSVLGANLSGNQLSLSETTSIASVFFYYQEGMEFAQDIEIEIDDLLITDGAGDEVVAVSLGNVLDMGLRPPAMVNDRVVDSIDDSVASVVEAVREGAVAGESTDIEDELVVIRENGGEGNGLEGRQEDEATSPNGVADDSEGERGDGEENSDNITHQGVSTGQDTTQLAQEVEVSDPLNDIQNIDIHGAPIEQDTTTTDDSADQPMSGSDSRGEDTQDAGSASQSQGLLGGADGINRVHGLRFDEILADPPAGGRGDANGDGKRDSREDEFIELVNEGENSFDLSRYLLSDDDVAPDKMFRFPVGTLLQKGERLVLFGGGQPQRIPGLVFVDDGSIGNGLTNLSDRIVLLGPTAKDTVLIGEYQNGNIDQSLASVGDQWIAHGAGAGKGIFSPGRARSVVDVLVPAPARVALSIGERISIQALVQYTDGALLRLDTELLWIASDTSIVSVDQRGEVIGRKMGKAEVWFFADGRESLRSQLTVQENNNENIEARRQAITLVISEVYPDPATGDQGDQNGDGQRHSYEDEFVEVHNYGDRAIDIGGFFLGDDDTAVGRLFQFPLGTVVSPGGVVVLFGGGLENSSRIDSDLVFFDDGRIGDGLSNAGDEVVLMRDDGITPVARMVYEGAKNGVSFVANEGGQPRLHTEVFDEVKSSPGEMPTAAEIPEEKVEEKVEDISWRLPDGLVFSEVLLNPGPVDANNDGIVSQQKDAFVELTNTGNDTLNLSGWLLGNDDIKVAQFFRFPPKTLLFPNDYLTVFGGGTPKGIAGTVLVSQGQIGGGLSHNGEVIHLAFPDGHSVAMSVIVPASQSGISWSLIKSSDPKPHPLLPERAQISPGRQAVSVTQLIGASQQLAVNVGDTVAIDVVGHLSDGNKMDFSNVVSWWVSDLGVLGVDGHRVVGKHLGTATIKAFWHDLQSAAINVDVSAAEPDNKIVGAVLDSVVIIEDADGTGAVVDTAEVQPVFEPEDDSLANAEEDSLATGDISGSIWGGEEAVTVAPDTAIAIRPNHPPVWISASDTSSLIGLTFQYKPVIEDEDDDPVVLSIRDDTQWLSWDGNILTGTPTADDVGYCTIRFQATDGRDTIVNTVSIQVLSLNETILEATALPAAGSLTWRQHIDIPPGVQVQVEGGPEWHPDDQSLVWRPQEPGVFPVLIAMSTETGDEILMPLTITVSALPAFEVHKVLVEPQRDVNGDGSIDHFKDQYLAIGNVGETAVDMSGWLLGDDDRQMTQLPDGVQIAPGDTLVLVGEIQEIPDRLIFSGQGRVGNGLAKSDRILLVSPAGPDTLINFSYSTNTPSVLGEQLDVGDDLLLNKNKEAVDEAEVIGSDSLDTWLYPSPNPFNSSTRVGFYTAGGPISMTVYSILGQPIRRLVQQSLPAGFHQRIWDGTNDLGMPVGSGIYLVYLQNQVTAQTHRVALLR